MAQTFDSLRLRLQRLMDRRLIADLADLARQVGYWVLRAAGSDGLIPNTLAARESLRQAIWEQVLKLYYIGRGMDAFYGGSPRSPFARLLYDGIRGVTRNAAEQQVALVRRVVKDPEVLRWLTGPRPAGVREMYTISGRITELNRLRMGEQPIPGNPLAGVLFPGDAASLVNPRGMYDPYYLWVDPNGYRLSDRVWNTSINVRSRIDALLDYEISRGTGATEIAGLLEQYLTPGARLSRTSTPYGEEGSYAARRLARTEITAAAGRASINSAAANPFVERMQWVLSPSHPKVDICDDYAQGGPNGDGVYAIADLPQYPPHPHCLCHLRPVPTGEVSDLIQQLREEIRQASPIAGVLQGMFSPEFLANALMTGTLEDVVRGADVFRAAQRAGVVR